MARVKKDAVATQVIAQGPVASQEVIKMYGTNGGGFFGANSTHPFENPTPLTNFVQMLLIFAIPSGLTYTLGRMTGSRRHGWAVWSAMAAMFLAGVVVVYAAESRGNPLLKGVANGAIGHAARRKHGRKRGALRDSRIRHCSRQLRRTRAAAL